MLKHEIKICERCGDSFECKIGNITHCQCSEVQLSEAMRQFLEESYFDCLCKNCLQEGNQRLDAMANLAFPQASELEENVHYYIENGAFVFTETYLLLRGYCCRNGCRHCPYGFKK